MAGDLNASAIFGFAFVAKFAAVIFSQLRQYETVIKAKNAIFMKNKKI